MSESESESESDYEEEDLDDFMIKASKILSKEKHPEKETMLKSLKLHLSSIFNDNSEMSNFFKTLNSVIFTSSKKTDQEIITNKQPFKLYPIIFSFNPKATLLYVDYLLTSLQLSASEINRHEFPYLSKIFEEVIKAFFSDEKSNKNLIKRSYLLDQSKKINLYEKLLNFCNNNIKTNKKIEQSFGCLLMTEFLENCPLTKDPKNLDSLFKLISKYLDDRWFLCKLDLLNCTMSLIFTAGKNFKPYATACLFKVLDYLTDEEWMKRKLAINIVYSLIFYCKEEIYSVKDNIVEFLFVLQKDPVKEVREVCVRTLNYINEVYPKKEKSKDFKSINLLFNKRLKNSKFHRNKSANKSYDATYTKGDTSSRINTSKSTKNNNRSANKNTTSNNYMDKLKKEMDVLDKLERQYNEKRSNFNVSKKKDRRRNNFYSQDFGMNSNSNTRILLEHYNTTLQNILQQIKIVKEEQNELKLMFDDIKQIVDKNYFGLNERLKSMEESSIYNYDNIKKNSASKSSNHKNYK
jgi:hypothetical protein